FGRGTGAPRPPPLHRAPNAPGSPATREGVGLGGGQESSALLNPTARETTRVVAPHAKGWVWEGRTPVPPPNSIVRALRCVSNLRVVPAQPVFRDERLRLARSPPPSLVHR